MLQWNKLCFCDSQPLFVPLPPPLQGRHLVGAENDSHEASACRLSGRAVLEQTLNGPVSSEPAGLEYA